MLDLLVVDVGAVLWALLIFTVLYVAFSKFIAPRQSTRRKMMIASWSAPSEGNIHGVMEVDVTNAQAYIKERRAAGEHPTITHLCIKAVGSGITQAPSLNGRLVWGKFFPHSHVDVGCLVAIDGGKDLANAKITNVDTRSIASIGRILRAKADKLRQKKDKDFNKASQMLRWLPVFVIRPLLYWLGFLGSALGLEIPALGVRRFPFGTCLVTSVGMLGCECAFVPFPPYARVPILVMIGGIADKAVVIDGEVVVRPMLTITATIDHRFVDGSEAAKLAARVRAVLDDPAAFDGEDDGSD